MAELIPLIIFSDFNQPAVPVADRCTISRQPAPGVRPADPFPGRLRDDASKAAIKDAFASITLAGERTVAAGVVDELILGIIPQKSVETRMTIFGYDTFGAPIPSSTLFTLLTPVKTRILADKQQFFEFQGQLPIGITFNADFDGGEEISVLIDNTDARSLLNGETLVYQFIVNADPEFYIEETRKGNPVP